MRDLWNIGQAGFIKHAETAPLGKRLWAVHPLISARLQPPHGHLMRGSLALRYKLVLHMEVGIDFRLSLGSVNAEVKQVDEIALVNHAIPAAGSGQTLLHGRHDVILGFFALVIFLGDLFLADLLKQLLVLVDEEIHLADGAVDVVLGALNVAVDFQNFDFKQFAVQRVFRLG